MSKNEAFDVADLSSALNVANREEIFNAVMNKLEGLDGEYSDFLENLSPIVRKRVDTLMEIQAKHDDVKAKYFEERAVLDAKYQMLYQPLYNERSQILNGVVEVDSETKVEEDAHQEKGVPEFWLTAMKNNSVLADEISERDEAALRFLNDIKCSRTDKPLGFKLEFFFDANPFFKNSVLTKTYHLVDEYEPVLDKAIGTEIEWYPGPGKCLTQRIVVKKPKNGPKKAKRNVKPEPCQSFFNFFDPPQLPEEDDKIDEGVAEKHQNLMEHDYDIGSTIRDKIIPNAVSWFTGEAAHRTFEDEPEDPMVDQPPN